MADEDIKIEKYQDFIDFDWSHEGWQSYLEGLYPQPSGRALTKYKRKWYKRHVDREFDETYEPYSDEPEVGGSSGSSSSAAAPGVGASASPSLAFPNGAFLDGTRWQVMRQKATICLGAYAIALVLAIGAFMFAFPAYQALLALVMASVLELLAKYGLKFSAEYMQHVLLDDVGVLPIMAITLLMPGLHPYLRTFSMLPFFLTAVMSFAQICKNHPTLSPRVRDFFSPLANSVARYHLMEWRGHLEVVVGLLLLIGTPTGYATPFSALLYWNWMMMRYMMSRWTQHSFSKIDNAIGPALGKIPGIKFAYAALKRWLYGFVDPESRRAGKLCTIL